MSALAETARSLYGEFGQRKAMGTSSPSPQLPHFFLLRTFLGENDLLVIFNTKRCRYQCHFCQLPDKSTSQQISNESICAQFRHIIFELRHALSILDRVTLSNEGSVLDSDTFPVDCLMDIAMAISEMRRVRTLVLETRLEFVNVDTAARIKRVLPRVSLNILTGFETRDEYIRDYVLGKREPIQVFLLGLDRVAQIGAHLTSFVLYKPDPAMTDEEAFHEAEATIDYLRVECHARGVPLSIRLNPMYRARGSQWARRAASTLHYLPPKLTDIMRLAEKKVGEGVAVYIGLSTEGLDEPDGSYMSRSDYSPQLLRPIKLFNDRKQLRFDWQVLQR